jgi:hypothetical protein
MRTAAILAALFPICFPAWLGAQSPPLGNQQDTENAAVKYLRADAALRQSYALAPDAPAKLQKALESPSDAEDERLVAAAEDALVEFHHGAIIQQCDWSMSFEDGPLANTAHRGAIMGLWYALLVFEQRHAEEIGDFARAAIAEFLVEAHGAVEGGGGV